jgi:hypothetical protein
VALEVQQGGVVVLYSRHMVGGAATEEILGTGWGEAANVGLGPHYNHHVREIQ